MLIISLALVTCSCTSSSEIEVPVNITGASDVGSLRFELDYDATVLQLSEVEQGDLASGTLFEYNANSPGRVIVGIVDATGINGTVKLVKIKFKVIQKGTESPLRIENVFAYHATTFTPLSFDSESGTFGGSSKAVTPPEIRFR